MESTEASPKSHLGGARARGLPRPGPTAWALPGARWGPGKRRNGTGRRRSRRSQLGPSDLGEHVIDPVRVGRNSRTIGQTALYPAWAHGVCQETPRLYPSWLLNTPTGSSPLHRSGDGRLVPGLPITRSQRHRSVCLDRAAPSARRAPKPKARTTPAAFPSVCWASALLLGKKLL